MKSKALAVRRHHEDRLKNRRKHYHNAVERINTLKVMIF